MDGSTHIIIIIKNGKRDIGWIDVDYGSLSMYNINLYTPNITFESFIFNMMYRRLIV